MIEDVKSIVYRSRFAMIQDAIGIFAIGVVMTVVLHLPSLV